LFHDWRCSDSASIATKISGKSAAATGTAAKLFRKQSHQRPFPFFTLPAYALMGTFLKSGATLPGCALSA